jgi:uncharacterized phiE125 gp8 family phage protein
MTYQLITPNAVLEVSLVDAKTQLGIDGADLDAIVTAWIKGVVAYAEHQTGRAILNQTWRTTLDKFPDAIRLPFPACSSITSLKYLDAAGVEQTLNPADYELSSESQAAWVVPAYGKTWPATYDKINAVKVDAVFGYGALIADVPQDFRLFILAKLREQFDAATRPEKDTVQSSFIDHLLDAKKVYG